MSDPFDWLDLEAARRQARHLHRELTPRGAALPGLIQDREATLVNFASNDYLGLAADPRVIDAATAAARVFGWGSGASPLVCGWRSSHAQLAAALAEFEQVEEVALFPSGFAANQGTISSLVGPGDAVYVDRLDHACIVAGARVSGARLRVYPHADAERLADLLARERSSFRRVLIATDGLFSMDGDLAPLARLAELAVRSQAMLLVDEAHATGVLGPTGRGAVEACGIDPRDVIRVGTLSKSLGSLGGFLAGSARLVRHVVNSAPTLIFSTSLPPAAAAAASEALRIARDEPWRRHRLAELSDHLCSRLAPVFPIMEGVRGPIIPILLGDSDRALAASEKLRHEGFLVPAIRPPTVPRGTARLRIGLCAVHDLAQIDALAQALKRIQTDAANEAR